MSYDFRFNVPLGARVRDIISDMWERKRSLPDDDFSCRFNGTLLTTKDCDSEQDCYDRWDKLSDTEAKRRRWLKSQR